MTTVESEKTIAVESDKLAKESVCVSLYDVNMVIDSCVEKLKENDGQRRSIQTAIINLLTVKRKIRISAHDNPKIAYGRESGSWIEENPLDSKYCRLIKCDRCGDTYVVNMEVPFDVWVTSGNKNFCGRCGAYMGGFGNGRIY